MQDLQSVRDPHQPVRCRQQERHSGVHVQCRILRQRIRLQCLHCAVSWSRLVPSRQLPRGDPDQQRDLPLQCWVLRDRRRVCSLRVQEP